MTFTACLEFDFCNVIAAGATQPIGSVQVPRHVRLLRSADLLESRSGL